MRKRARSPARATVWMTNGPAAMSSSGIRNRRWGARRAGHPVRRRRIGVSAQRAIHAALEPLDLAGGVDDVLGTGIERMALGADLDPDRFGGRPDREGIATYAVDLRLMVLGVDVRLHWYSWVIP